MNKITNAERERIHGRAMEIVRLDPDGKVLDKNTTIGRLMDEFTISRDRSIRHVAKAARRLRYGIIEDDGDDDEEQETGGRTERFNLRIAPATRRKLDGLARAWGCSVSDVIHKLAEERGE